MYFNQVEFGQRIKKLRALRDVTQEELAKEMNISYEHLAKIERGHRGCSLDFIIDISDYFNVNTDYLLTGHDCGNTEIKKRLENIVGELKLVIHSLK